jgi:hypothetical protein
MYRSSPGATRFYHAGEAIQVFKRDWVTLGCAEIRRVTDGDPSRRRGESAQCGT